MPRADYVRIVPDYLPLPADALDETERCPRCEIPMPRSRRTTDLTIRVGVAVGVVGGRLLFRCDSCQTYFFRVRRSPADEEVA